MKFLPLIGLVPLTVGFVIALYFANNFIACVWVLVGVVILADLPKPPPIK